MLSTQLSLCLAEFAEGERILSSVITDLFLLCMLQLFFVCRCAVVIGLLFVLAVCARQLCATLVMMLSSEQYIYIRRH
jgi:hypothetical protein